MADDIWLTGSLSTTASALLDLLLSQQTKRGLHVGQFGDHADQSEVHQPHPLMDVAKKPRLYMTLWPCRILRRGGLAEDSVQKAADGVKRLFANGLVPGDEDNDPIPPRTRYVSYRHSLCGALILFELIGRNAITDRVLGGMLDWESPWRAKDHGWGYSDSHPGQSDLYTSLYAIELLKQVHVSPYVEADLADAASEPLETTLDYLERAWEADRWAYGNLKSEESFPLVFAEVAEILQAHRPNLFNEVADEILLHRHPVGGMRASYRGRVRPKVSDESCLARLAYAAYLACLSTNVWTGFASLALRGDLRTLTSAELAWLLDLELHSHASEN